MPYGSGGKLRLGRLVLKKFHQSSAKKNTRHLPEEKPSIRTAKRELELRRKSEGEGRRNSLNKKEGGGREERQLPGGGAATHVKAQRRKV